MGLAGDSRQQLLVPPGQRSGSLGLTGEIFAQSPAATEGKAGAGGLSLRPLPLPCSEA